jgi:hypothetical protein
VAFLWKFQKRSTQHLRHSPYPSGDTLNYCNNSLLPTRRPTCTPIIIPNRPSSPVSFGARLIQSHSFHTSVESAGTPGDWAHLIRPVPTVTLPHQERLTHLTADFDRFRKPALLASSRNETVEKTSRSRLSSKHKPSRHRLSILEHR